MICLTCNQPIRLNEKTDTFDSGTFHENPRDCVKATAWRCMEIAATEEPSKRGTVRIGICRAIGKEFGVNA